MIKHSRHPAKKVRRQKSPVQHYCFYRVDPSSEWPEELQRGQDPWKLLLYLSHDIIPITSLLIWERWKIQGFATPLNQVLMFSLYWLFYSILTQRHHRPTERYKTKATYFGSFGSSARQDVKFITRSDRMNWWHHSKPVSPPVGSSH